MPYLKKFMTDADREGLTKSIVARDPRLKLPGITAPVCDFCGADNPNYIYAADRMTDGTETRCWRWAACEFCSIAVDVEDWAYIEEKITEKVKLLLPEGMRGNPLFIRIAQSALQAFHDDAMKIT